MPVAVTTACYTPTEIVVELSTDLRCTDAPQTTIFRGPPFDTLPNASTSDCAEIANADTRIGTVTVVPTEDADRASLKVVIAARGRRIEDCEAHPEDCIVARRSFSYVKHRSLRLPIRLLSECFGEPCADGTTCGPGGICLGDSVACASRDVCQLSEEAPAAAAPPAGSSPAQTDGGPGPTPTSCALPSGTALATTQNVPSHVAVGKDAILYDVNAPAGSAIPTKIVRVPRAGGATPSDVVQLRLDQQLLGVGVVGNQWVYAWSEGLPGARKAKLRAEGGGEVTLSGLPSAAGTPLAIASTTGAPAAYFAYLGGLDRVTDLLAAAPKIQTVATSGASYRVTADAAWVYVLHKSNLGAIDLALVGPEKTLPLRGDLGPAVFASDGDRTWFVGVDVTNPASPGPSSLFGLQGGSFTTLRQVSQNTSLIAIDATHVYWSNRLTIWRTPRGALGTTPQVVYAPKNGEAIAHLSVDSGCIYFWAKATDADAVLRVVPATPP